MPEINQDELREAIESRLREGLIKDYKRLYVKEYTTTWEIERVVLETEIDIMKFENTINSIMSLLAHSNVAIVKVKQEVPSPDEWKHEDDEYIKGYGDARKDYKQAGFVQVERIK